MKKKVEMARGMKVMKTVKMAETVKVVWNVEKL